MNGEEPIPIDSLTTLPLIYNIVIGYLWIDDELILWIFYY